MAAANEEHFNPKAKLSLEASRQRSANVFGGGRSISRIVEAI